jgi:hypothetical protein
MLENGGYSPHVRWARWQAKHALRAFFLRGLRGSFAFEAGFWPLELFCEGEPSSVFCSAAISSSKSLLYSGEGEASWASGEAMISPLLVAGPRARTDAAVVATAGAEDARLVFVQPSVITLGSTRPNGSANVSGRTAVGVSSGVFWSAVTRALAARTGAAVQSDSRLLGSR